MEPSTSRSRVGHHRPGENFLESAETADTTTVQIFLPTGDGIGSDFLSLVLERIDMSVIQFIKNRLQNDSTPHPPLSSIEEEKCPNRPFIPAVC